MTIGSLFSGIGGLELGLERAAARPPCPHCGSRIDRVGASAKIPKYCSPRCSRAARFARWYAHAGQARNERRRKTDRQSPMRSNSTETGEKP